ncbi:hypothetical protein, partial [Paraburkholderia sp.]|uniref:hypothetical protein n=1 Tax=Paraburkholderia sp. TaxID=1926495 RepID=UPI002F404DA7
KPVKERLKPIKDDFVKRWWLATKSWSVDVWDGKHRSLMPAISLALMVFFILVFIFADWLQKGVSSDTSVQIYLTGGIDGYCPEAPDKLYKLPQSTSIVRSEKFSDFRKGSAALDCNRSDVAGRSCTPHFDERQ